MLICISCGETFREDEIKTVKEQHPYGEGYATEEWAACPSCGDTDICEAKQCERCAELVAELTDGLCDCCHGEMYE